MTLKAYVFPKLQTAKELSGRMSKKSCSKTPFDSQHVEDSKQLRNQHDSIFIILFHRYEGNRVRKYLC